MPERLNAIAVLGVGQEMWLYITKTRVVGAIDIPDRFLSGRFLDPPLSSGSTSGNGTSLWIDPGSQSFTYSVVPVGKLPESVPREDVLFANVHVQVEANDKLKLVLTAQEWMAMQRAFNSMNWYYG